MVHFTNIMGTLALTLTAVQAVPNLAARQLPDPAGAKNLGNGGGVQFIGGQCSSAADCASGCCATLPRNGATIGVCSGVGAQFQAGKQGCGFGGGGNGGAGAGAGAGNNGGGSNNPTPGNVMAAPAPSPPPVNVVPIRGPTTTTLADGSVFTIIPSDLKVDPAGANNIGTNAGIQFIGGECLSDQDCASGCCALVDSNAGSPPFGICSGKGANRQNGKQGCGFPRGGGNGIAPSN